MGSSDQASAERAAVKSAANAESVNQAGTDGVKKNLLGAESAERSVELPPTKTSQWRSQKPCLKIQVFHA